ncbi:MAG: hypothetical protein DRJ40_02120 [Thermoprotei archaeon]|nr:MAG: hypothetical protein DRJ40_02120 [Thermoprotei archaeon]
MSSVLSIVGVRILSSGLAVAFYSGSRGGTGKTTLSLLTSLLISAIEVPKRPSVLFIDLGYEVNSATYILFSRIVPPTYVDLVKADEVDLCEYRINLNGKESRLYFVSCSDVLVTDDILLKLRHVLPVLKKEFDLVVLDFPSSVSKYHHELATSCDVVVLVSDCSELTVKYVTKLPIPGDRYVVAVLNKYRKEFLDLKLKLGEVFPVVYTVSFESSLELLGQGLQYFLKFGRLSKQFSQDLVNLCKFIYDIRRSCRYVYRLCR